MKANKITLVYAYYNSAGMLQAQLFNWLAMPKDIMRHVNIILIDDGSPLKPALDVLKANAPLGLPLAFYRVLTDIPWNQHGCRNLGADQAADGWLFMSDIDHMLPYDSLKALVYMPLDPAKFYTLQRVTAVKKEDGNLKYDLMTDIHGKPKPHPNTFLITRKRYWEAGGYDEDYCGTYGGDGPFMRQLERIATREHLQHLDLIRWTRDLIPDASQPPEYREAYRGLYRPLFEKKGGGKAHKPTSWVRFPWEKVDYETA